MENLIDQENRPLGGGPLGRRTKATEAEPTRTRAVLGEISQNIRRQPLRTNGNKPNQGSFSIFCDDTAPAKPASTSFRSEAGFSFKGADASYDKENILPRENKEKVGRSVDVLRVQQHSTVYEEAAGGELRFKQTRAVQLLHHQEPMNTSVDLDSPMVVEEQKEQWRVPPIKDNHTVDIFTEPEYFQDIYRYLKQSEVKHLPKWNYMAKQTDITHSMRSILVDWLVEVGEEYKLQTETLHLAINYIDRFLSYMAVQRSKLQLVGAACMFIAAKYEEIYPPDVSEFVYITDDTYNKRQVLRMEHLVLKVLGFDLSVPSSFLFLNKMVEMEQLEQDVKDRLAALAAYLAELALVDGENYLKYPPSQVAASCVALSRHTLELEAWPEFMEHKTGYKVGELRECLLLLNETFVKAETSAQQAVRDKYRAPRYFGVSDLSPPAI